MKSRTLRTIAGTLGAVILLGAAAALVMIKTGMYNVAAAKPHLALTQGVLSAMMENSVRRHAANITLGPSFDSPDLSEGFEHYRAMCMGCHGAPGVERGEIGTGLNPPAPELAAMESDHSPQEVYWIIKNGIKMTGMPAFGPTHDDEKLWDLTALVLRLPEMSPSQFHELANESDEHGAAHHH